MNDDLLDRSATLPGPLVPYRCGVPCWHQLRDEAEARVDGAQEDDAGVRPQREVEAVSA